MSLILAPEVCATMFFLLLLLLKELRLNTIHIFTESQDKHQLKSKKNQNIIKIL